MNSNKSQLIQPVFQSPLTCLTQMEIIEQSAPQQAIAEESSLSLGTEIFQETTRSSLTLQEQKPTTHLLLKQHSMPPTLQSTPTTTANPAQNYVTATDVLMYIGIAAVAIIITIAIATILILQEKAHKVKQRNTLSFFLDFFEN